MPFLCTITTEGVKFLHTTDFSLKSIPQVNFSGETILCEYLFLHGLRIGFESNRTKFANSTLEMSGHRWFNIFPRPSLQETDTPTGDPPSEALLTRICQVPFYSWTPAIEKWDNNFVNFPVIICSILTEFRLAAYPTRIFRQHEGICVACSSLLSEIQKFLSNDKELYVSFRFNLCICGTHLDIVLFFFLFIYLFLPKLACD